MADTRLQNAISNQINGWIVQYGDLVIIKSITPSFDVKNNKRSNSTPNIYDRDISKIEEQLDGITLMITTICKRNQLQKLFLIFRSILYEPTVKKISALTGLAIEEWVICLSEANLLGTNFILSFSDKNFAFENRANRYSYSPTNEEIHDAYQLYCLSLIHIHEKYFLNTAIRYQLVFGKESANQLIEIFNRRQNHYLKDFESGKKDDAYILYPLAAFSLHKTGTQNFSVFNGHLGQVTLDITNYFPLQVVSGISIEPYAYLSSEAFKQLFGISYFKFLLIWKLLNDLLSRTFLLQISSKQIKGFDKERLIALIEHTDDYMHECCGWVKRDELAKSCKKLFDLYQTDSVIDMDDIGNFIDTFSYPQKSVDINFIEQPSIFYDIGNNYVIWDYLRHPGFLKSVAREFKRKSSANHIPVNFGDVFENLITSKLSSKRVRIQNIKPNVKLKLNNEIVWEIDLTVTIDGVLFIIEAKDWFKNINYHLAKASEVSSRTGKLESVLQKIDNNLKKYSELLKQQLASSYSIEISGAICILISSEVEFISSTEEKYWLEKNLTPRICMVDELINYLSNPLQGMEIKNHECFLGFN